MSFERISDKTPIQQSPTQSDAAEQPAAKHESGPAEGASTVTPPRDGMDRGGRRTALGAVKPTRTTSPALTAPKGVSPLKGSPRTAASDISDGEFKAKFGRSWTTYKKTYVEASAEDRAVLKKVMAGPNRRQAFASFKQLKGLQAQTSSAGAGKLPDSVIRTLTVGIGVPRASSQNGREGVIGASQASQAAQAYASMDASDRAAFDRLLAKAGRGRGGAVQKGADPEAERGLLLKALAARRGRVKSSASARSRAGAMKTISAFAGEIRGMNRDTLVRKTTLLDLDETRNDSRFDPKELEKRGRMGVQRWHDSDKTNDGLFQRYVMSCGPAATEMILAERDPIHAFNVHRDGIGSATTRSTAGEYQKRLMKKYAAHFQARLAVYNYERSKNNLDALVTAGKVTIAERDACLLHLAGRGPDNADAKAGLAALRKRSHGFPSAGRVKEMRENDPTGQRIGVTDQQLKLMLKQIDQQTGVNYDMLKVLPNRNAVPQAAVDRVAKDLGDGVDVVFSTKTHFWSMSAVKGSKPDREFLVHDTWTGKTMWVKEGQVKSGAFIKKFWSGHSDATDGVEYFFPKK